MKTLFDGVCKCQKWVENSNQTQLKTIIWYTSWYFSKGGKKNSMGGVKKSLFTPLSPGILDWFGGREMGQPPARTALFIRQHKCDKIQPGPSMEGPDECIRTNSPPPYSTYLIPQNELILIAGKQNPWNKFIIIGLMILFGFISVLLRSCYGCKAR